MIFVFGFKDKGNGQNGRKGRTAEGNIEYQSHETPNALNQ